MRLFVGICKGPWDKDLFDLVSLWCNFKCSLILDKHLVSMNDLSHPVLKALCTGDSMQLCMPKGTQCEVGWGT